MPSRLIQSCLDSRLVEFLETRGIRTLGLLAAAVVSFSRGYAYLFVPEVTHEIPAELFSVTRQWLDIYAGCWFLGGVSAFFLACVWRKVWPLILLTAVPCGMWAGIYLAAWWTGISDSGWLGGTLYGAISVLLFSMALTTPRGGWRDEPAAVAAI